MKFACKVSAQPDGRWVVRHVAENGDNVEASAGTREDALEKMRGELRYRLELCPCSGDTYQHVAIEILDEDDASQNRSP